MTTAAELRQAIVDLLIPIPNIGMVHDYERFSVQASDLKKLYHYNNRLQGWFVTRAGWRKVRVGSSIFQLRSNWEVNGYMGLDDENKSEQAFDALVDLIQLVLSKDPSFGIGESVENYEIKATLQHVMFHGVLCHNAVISFDTEHVETATIDEAMGDFLTMYSQFDFPPHEGNAEHEKWNQDTPDYSTSIPELTAEIHLKD